MFCIFMYGAASALKTREIFKTNRDSKYCSIIEQNRLYPLIINGNHIFVNTKGRYGPHPNSK